MMYYLKKTSGLDKLMVLSILTIWITFFPNTVFSQKSSVPELRDFQSVEPQSLTEVRTIVQDQLGFLWIGSDNGLYRYDGWRLKTFRRDPNDPTSLNYNSVTRIIVSRQGGLWILTQNNVISYLDHRTGIFTLLSLDPRYFATSGGYRISSIYEDHTGGLWIGSRDKGLLYRNPTTGEYKSFIHDPKDTFSISSNQIVSVIEDSRLDLWIGTQGGLNRMNRTTGQFERFVHAPDDPHSISVQVGGIIVYEDSKGMFWVGTQLGGLNRLDRNTKKFEHFIHDPKDPNSISWGGINVIFEKSGDPDNLWIGTSTGLEKLNHHTGQFEHFYFQTQQEVFETDYQVNAIFEDREGNLWVGGNFGLKQYNSSKKKFTYLLLDTANDPALNIGGPVIEDRWGNFWIGTGKGLFFWDRQQTQLEHFPFDNEAIPAFYSTDLAKPYYEHVVSAICEDRSGVLWVGGKRLYQLNRSTGKLQTFLPFNFSQLNSLLEDYQGNLWLGSNYGVETNIDTASRRFEHYLYDPDDTRSISNNAVSVIYEDSEHTLWIGTYFHGLNRLEFEHDIRNWKSQSTIDRDLVLNSYRDANNSFVDAVKGPGRTTRYLHDKQNPHSLSEDRILAIFEDSRGRFWIGTKGGGLNLMDRATGSFQSFSADLQNASDDIYAILEDDRGKLWLSTGNGLAQFDPDTKMFRHFDQGDGLPERSFGSGIKDIGTGELLFHGGNGLLIFHPDSIRQDSTPAPIEFTSFSWYDEKAQSMRTDHFIAESRSVVLPWHDKILTFEFGTLSFYKTQKCRYRYQLYGASDQWYDLGTVNQVSFTQLQPGHYTLRIKGTNGDGVWNPEVSEMAIHILPPWWMTWYAKLLYLLLLLGSIYLLYRFMLKRRLAIAETRRIVELDGFKSRFYTNITHEFRTPLTVIKGMADQISGNEKIKALIRKNSDRLLLMINQLLDLSKLENNSLQIKWVQGDIIPYLQYLTESCHSLAENKRLNLAFFSREEQLIMDFDEDKLQQIVLNLLSNAIKFTPTYGTVKVMASKVEQKGVKSLELEVKDTGRGIPPEKLDHIFDRFYQVDDSATRQGEGSGIGLALVRELVQLMEGRTEVSSELGKGSSFKVYLPIHQQAGQRAFTPEAWSQPTLVATPSVIAVDNKLIETAPDSEKPLILIIEDNADVTKYIVSCLQPDYQVQTSANGRLGVEKALQIIPDVILCDVMMPEMDGFEVCRQLKKAAPTSHIPIVLLTAKATQEDKVAGLSQGADAYLTKPFDKSELLVRLENLSRLSRQLQERLTAPAAPESVSGPVETKEAAFLEELRRIVDDHLGNEDFDTPRLCRAIAMSRTQLHRKLKALTGQSTAAYIRHCRLQKARSLLAQTNLPIGEIAAQVGFKDFSHFSKTFLQEFGVSPSGVSRNRNSQDLEEIKS